MTMRSGALPCASSQRYAATQSSNAAGKGCSGARRFSIPSVRALLTRLSVKSKRQ
jgi:hypothetical protein